MRESVSHLVCIGIVLLSQSEGLLLLLLHHMFQCLYRQSLFLLF